MNLSQDIVAMSAIPVALVVISSAAGVSAQVSSALDDPPSDAFRRIRRSTLGTFGVLLAMALITGNTNAVLSVAITGGLAWLYVDHVLLNPV